MPMGCLWVAYGLPMGCLWVAYRFKYINCKLGIDGLIKYKCRLDENRKVHEIELMSMNGLTP